MHVAAAAGHADMVGTLAVLGASCDASTRVRTHAIAGNMLSQERSPECTRASQGGCDTALQGRRYTERGLAPVGIYASTLV